MSYLGSGEIYFEQCDSDSQNVDTTGGTLAALFTNLSFVAGREVILRNRVPAAGSNAANILIGKTAAAARFRILPGEAFSLRPRDLAKVAIKSDAGTQVVDVFLVV